MNLQEPTPPDGGVHRASLLFVAICSGETKPILVVFYLQAKYSLEYEVGEGGFLVATP